jgi:hypothetical protein
MSGRGVAEQVGMQPIAKTADLTNLSNQCLIPKRQGFF